MYCLSYIAEHDIFFFNQVVESQVWLGEKRTKPPQWSPFLTNLQHYCFLLDLIGWNKTHFVLMFNLNTTILCGKIYLMIHNLGNCYKRSFGDFTQKWICPSNIPSQRKNVYILNQNCRAIAQSSFLEISVSRLFNLLENTQPVRNFKQI